MSKYSGGRYLDAISLINDLTGTEKAILRHIASKIDFRDFSKSRYMSYQDIADETSFCRNTCYRSVVRLAELGYISKTFTENHGKNSANIYKILERIFENVPKEAKDSQPDYTHTEYSTCSDYTPREYSRGGTIP
jgi:predicted transcriptional regulator